MGQQHPSCCGSREQRSSCYLCDPTADTVKVDVQAYHPNQPQQADTVGWTAGTSEYEPEILRDGADEKRVGDGDLAGAGFVAPSKLMKAALAAKADAAKAEASAAPEDGSPVRRRPPKALIQRHGERRQSELDAEERWRATREEWEKQVREQLEKEALASAQSAPPPERDNPALSSDEERLQALAMIRMEEAQRREEDKAAQNALREGQTERTDEGCEGGEGGEAAAGSGELDACVGGDADTGDDVAAAAAAGAAAADDAAKVSAFLRGNGFKGGPRDGKKTMLRTTYPLHVAATKGDAEMVRLLLKEGADAAQKNSAGQTAESIAQKKNSKGSHEEVLSALREAPGEPEADGL